jgi:cell wall-active antibiotic response 4TMS protein YvqF
MATPARSSGLFSGTTLVFIGVLMLLYNYGHLDLGGFAWRWWPLLFIFWGALKLYERTAGRRYGTSGAGRVTGNEAGLVLAAVAVVAIVVLTNRNREWPGTVIDVGDTYSYDLDVAPRKIPSNARVLVHNGRGDIIVRGSDSGEIRVTAKKMVKSWSETEAARIADRISVGIEQNGDGYEVRPTGYDLSNSHIGVEMEVTIPKKSVLTVKTDKGDVTISGISSDVVISDMTGDVDIRDTSGDVNVEMRKGDTKVSGTKGDVKVSGKGGEIEVNDATGSLTVEGEFYGPVRADKVVKGVRMVSSKADLTLSALAGHLEAGSGNLDIVDAPGNLTLRTRDAEINVENPGGKVNIDNRNASIGVRFSTAPKEDIQITNFSSEIALTVPGTASFEVTADCRNCEINSEFPGLGASKTESGDSHLTGKYGNGKGPKITLKTSYGNISLRRTSVAIPAPPALPAPPAPPAPREIPPVREQ